jgi:uncharacterized protein (TIGR03083 family)
MTKAIDALAADRAVLLDICARLEERDWKSDSGCPGWSVLDVVAHLGALFWAVVDPTQLPDVAGLPTEQAQDTYVESRRGLSPAQVVADYAAVSAQALELLATFDGQDAEIPLGDLGTYPLSVIPTAYSFDHYVHIRADLFAPRGPLAGPPPPSDELRLGPALDWAQAALPQQNAAALAALGGAIEFVIQGPAARTITAGTGEVRARVSCGAPEFLRSVTQRATWQEPGVTFTGDAASLAAARQLKVF